MESSKRYSLVACGGTFDLFHKGHRSFLATALALSGQVYIGITSDVFVASRKGHDPIESYGERARAVSEYVQSQGAFDRVKILPIDSVFFPKIWEDAPFEAIIVTEESLPGAKKVNEKRVHDGKGELPIIASPLIQAMDGLPISSTRIREGSIDREGQLLADSLWYRKALLLPENLRQELQKPFGELIEGEDAIFSDEEKQKLLAVGDVTSVYFHARSILPKISVVDLIVERERRYKTLSEMQLLPVNLTYSVQNTPGQISPKVFSTVRDAFENTRRGKTVLIVIDGEEDLVVLPLLLHAPLGWVLCYGQPHAGMVKVLISEDIKHMARSLLKKFTPI